MGGSDCIYIGLIGLSIGYYACYAVIIAEALSIPHILIVMRRENKLYPFLPYIAIGYILTLFMMYKAQVTIPFLF